MTDKREQLKQTQELLDSGLAGFGRLCAPTGTAARIVAWVLFWVSGVLMLIAIPICWAGPQLREVAAKSESPAARAVAGFLMSPVTEPLRVDESAGTVVCFAMFFGVLVRLIDYCRRFDTLKGWLHELRSHPKNHSLLERYRKEPELEPLLADLRPGLSTAEREERITRFHRNLVQQTRIRQYEDYLLAIGLLGTMLGFYFGFHQHLSPGLDYTSLDQTARELLTVVGTAAISTVAGVAFGMLAVPPMANHLAVYRSELLDLAGEAVDAIGR